MQLFASITWTGSVELPVVVGEQKGRLEEDMGQDGGRVRCSTDQAYGVVPRGRRTEGVAVGSVDHRRGAGGVNVVDTRRPPVMLWPWVAPWPLASVPLTVNWRYRLA